LLVPIENEDKMSRVSRQVLTCSGTTTAAKGPFIGRIFTDSMVGGGTSVEVALAMRIEAHGLNVHSGFNILKRHILDEVGKPSDLVLSHPPVTQHRRLQRQ